MRILPVLLSAAALWAQPGRGPGGFPRMHPVIGALDADRDGAISPTERNAAPRALRGLDRNADGALTFDELRPGFPGGPERRPENSPDLWSSLSSFDKNHDGALEKNELPERMQGMVARGDADRDGKLTREELAKLAPTSPGEGPRGPGGPPRDPLLSALDKDGDGKISAPELDASATSLASLDKNGDGTISAGETRPPFGPGGRGGRGGNPSEMARHMVEDWDRNGDAKVSREEMPEPMRGRFTEADTDGDGALTATELAAVFSRGGRGGRP